MINVILLSFAHCSFDQLDKSNHSLTVQGSNLPFSLKSGLSITYGQKTICSKTLICRQLFAGHMVGSGSMKEMIKYIEL